jgi:hypothetical protein
LHANFKLSGEGEYIGLYDNGENANALIDAIEFGVQQTDVSYGRLPNGSGPFQFLVPTPGSMNEAISSIETALPIVQYQLYPNPAHEQVLIKADQTVYSIG